MKQSERLKLERLLRHCRMFAYACSGLPEHRINEVANDFFQFGLLHLTSTAFILESGGLFHRILDPMGYGHLLKDVDSALNSKVGKTTLREFIRLKRNKLATHGDLSFYSQPKEIQNVTFSKRALREFERAMSALETAAYALSRKLKEMVRQPAAPRATPSSTNSPAKTPDRRPTKFKLAGGLRHLRKETARINRLIEKEFERIEPEESPDP